MTLLAFALWPIATQSRQYLIHPWCSGPQAATLCDPRSIPAIDQVSLGLESGSADGFSYATQNFSGFFAIGVITLWNGATTLLGTATPAGAAAAIGADLLYFAQASAWNGVLNEVFHLITRRPRPFVYLNASIRGLDPAHYTSFYSGHTSFSAVAAMSLLLILLARGAPLSVLLPSVAISQSLVFCTGIFRVLAGRHFVTDVVAAACLGSLVTFWTFRRRRGK
jgi:membrane-associated phospholipid phosphatase